MLIKRSLFFLFKSFLFFVFAALVINQYFGKAYTDLLVFLGAFFTLKYNYEGRLFSDIEEKLILFGVGAFLLALGGFFHQNAEFTRFGPNMETYVKALLPLVVLPILYFLKIQNLKFLVNSVMFAAFTAGFITLLIDMPQGLPRYERLSGAPIIFGDLAMLFGLLSFSFSFLYFKEEKVRFAALILAGLLGVFASLYSGSRGGWIALFTVPFIFIFAADKNYRTRLFSISFVLIFVLIAGIMLTDNSVHHRLLMAWNEIHRLLLDPDWTGGSLGSRLAFYKISLLAFLSSPVWGIGVGEFYAFKMAYIQAHPELHLQGLMRYKHSHNEYLTILSSMGLIGFMFYVAFFAWLIGVFKKAISSDEVQIKAIGVAGMVTVFCFLDFSLSESFLSSRLGAPTFYLIVTFLIYFFVKLGVNREVKV